MSVQVKKFDPPLGKAVQHKIKAQECWTVTLPLQPGLQLHCVDCRVPDNLAVDFNRRDAFLEFGCLLSGQVRGYAELDNGQECFVHESSGTTWCGFCERARGTFEYLAGAPLCVVYFLATETVLENILQTQCNYVSTPQEFFNSTGHITPDLCCIIRQIMEAASSQGRVDGSKRLLLISKAYELLSHLLVKGQSAPQQIRDFEKQTKIEQAQALLDNNLSSPPSLEYIARQCGLCVTSLTEEFKKQLGITVFGYLRQQRLARAKHLIQEQHMNASEAAWDVGYSSLSSFHRAFFEHYGVTPGSFRRKRS